MRVHSGPGLPRGEGCSRNDANCPGQACVRPCVLAMALGRRDPSATGRIAQGRGQPALGVPRVQARKQNQRLCWTDHESPCAERLSNEDGSGTFAARRERVGLFPQCRGLQRPAQARPCRYGPASYPPSIAGLFSEVKICVGFLGCTFALVSCSIFKRIRLGPALSTALAAGL